MRRQLTTKRQGDFDLALRLIVNAGCVRLQDLAADLGIGEDETLRRIRSVGGSVVLHRSGPHRGRWVPVETVRRLREETPN